MLRSCRVLRALLIAGLAGFTTSASAQTAPQTITFVVSFAPGGVADVVARLVALKLNDRGYKVVVENRAGAGGNLAARVVAGAAPDGATILATTTALSVNATASRNKGYATEDLRAIAIAASSPDVMAVHPSNTSKDLAEFIKGVGGRGISYGSPGLGTSPYIAAAYFFRDVAKLNAVHVPFSGGAPAVAAVAGNHVDIASLSLATAAAQIQQGVVRGLGVASPKRVPSVANVPTYGESGFPNFYSVTWVGFFAPGQTPNALVTKLNADINETLKDKEVQQKLATVGFDSFHTTPAEATDYFKNEVATWEKMSRAIGYSTE
jgi:tripartite-type tricarboxylate transporter receptor subunit TctC